MPIKKQVYKGQAWGLYAPEIFGEFMNGDFKLRCHQHGIDPTVNPEAIQGGMMYHLPALGIDVSYRSDGTGALVELLATRPVHISFVERIIREEEER